MTAATFTSQNRIRTYVMFVAAMLSGFAMLQVSAQGEETPVRPKAVHTFAVDHTAADRATPHRIEGEFHPEVGIGPPLERTALRPESDPATGYAAPGALPMGNPFDAQQEYPQQDYPAQPQNFGQRGFQGRRHGGQARGGGVDPNNWQPQGQPFQNGPAPTNNSTEPTHSTKVSARYQDSRMLNLLGQTSFNQLASLFAETSRLIDSRHVSPPSYEDRTSQALVALADSVANPEFLAANRANPSAQAVQAFQQELLQMAQTQQAHNANDALGMMQWASEMAQQQIGVRREAVALEFINCTIDSLDKYSGLVPAKSQSGPSASLEERIVGIGVELKTNPQGVLVTGVIEGGPAAQAGVKKGDVIVGVDGRALAGMSLSQAADLIGGPNGSMIRLDLSRNGQVASVTAQRRSVYVSSVVDAKFLDSQRKVGYLKVKQFSESTTQDLTKEMWNLYNAGMTSLVLDLRGNPGGLLTQAVSMSDVFLPSGTIVSTRGRNEADNSDFQAKRDQTWKIPMVVLIDDHSASASEIFAAAIQDNQRGVILGQRSYGKGTVQTHFPLQAIAGDLKLTTAKFYSPNGREMAGQGVTPDVPVAQVPGAMDVDDTRDPDLYAALQVVNSGQPAQMAQSAGNGSGRQLGRVFGR
jgi:carboxyl-terminal processing protease